MDARSFKWSESVHDLEETPSGVLDARGLADEHFLAQDMVHPHHVGDSYVAKFNQRHCWYYWRRMQSGEGILIENTVLFENMDSELDGRTRCNLLQRQDVVLEDEPD